MFSLYLIKIIYKCLYYLSGTYLTVKDCFTFSYQLILNKDCRTKLNFFLLMYIGSYSNIIIETRRFCPDWWGTAEPIVITTFNRDENTKSGTIKNVRFFNVTAKGENGVLIHGNDENIIEDITFENCKIELTKTSKWQCGLYDLRPCLDYGVESYDNSAFFIRFAKDVTIRKTKTRWGNLCDNYKYAIDAKNVENLLLSDFDGHSVDESMDDYKLDNVSLIK